MLDLRLWLSFGSSFEAQSELHRSLIVAVGCSHDACWPSRFNLFLGMTRYDPVYTLSALALAELTKQRRRGRALLSYPNTCSCTSGVRFASSLGESDIVLVHTTPSADYSKAKRRSVREVDRALA